MKRMLLAAVMLASTLGVAQAQTRLSTSAKDRPRPPARRRLAARLHVAMWHRLRHIAGMRFTNVAMRGT